MIKFEERMSRTKLNEKFEHAKMLNKKLKKKLKKTLWCKITVSTIMKMHRTNVRKI
jgi:hypothetical protein